MTEREYIESNFLHLVNGQAILKLKYMMDAGSENASLGSDRFVAAAIANGQFSRDELSELLARDEDFIREYLVDKVLRDHKAEVAYNRCPSCDALARTPISKQCSACGARW